jgi:hypothetical protein
VEFVAKRSIWDKNACTACHRTNGLDRRLPRRKINEASKLTMGNGTPTAIEARDAM